MMYPFLTLDDQTEIVHSDMNERGEVKVYIEKPDAKDCFHSAVCYLPAYRWEEIQGFTDADVQRYQEVIQSTAHLIMEFSQAGPVDDDMDSARAILLWHDGLCKAGRAVVG